MCARFIAPAIEQHHAHEPPAPGTRGRDLNWPCVSPECVSRRIREPKYARRDAMPLVSASRSCCRQVAVRVREAHVPATRVRARVCTWLRRLERIGAAVHTRLPLVPRLGLRARAARVGQGWIASDKHRRRWCRVLGNRHRLHTHQSDYWASSPPTLESLPPPLRAPPVRAPPLTPPRPRQHPASRAPPCMEQACENTQQHKDKANARRSRHSATYLCTGDCNNEDKEQSGLTACNFCKNTTVLQQPPTHPATHQCKEHAFSRYNFW